MAFFFLLFHSLVIHEIHACSVSNENKTHHPFIEAASNVDLFEYYDHATFSNVANPIQCAILTKHECFASKGFVYDPASDLCRPVFWDRTSRDTEIPALGSGTGALYRFTKGACRQGFQQLVYEYESKNITTCVSLATDTVLWWDAKKNCKNDNSFLASTKTADKLAMLVELSQGEPFWVGLDDRNRNQEYVWTEDLSILPKEMISVLFEDGQPTNGREQDCMAVMRDDSKLSDAQCGGNGRLYFCEAWPGC